MIEEGGDDKPDFYSRGYITALQSDRTNKVKD